MASHFPFTVIHEDNHLLVVNKASGILVQGDSTGDPPLGDLCKQYIKEKYQKPGPVFLGVVHRLDRPVSGVVVLARTSKALERMNRLFKERETIKTYFAIVSKRPPKEQGTLCHWLVKDQTKNKTTAFSVETDDAMRSELTYETRAEVGSNWLLRVNPLTGRPHQIRVQLASMGCPILGDLKYGSAQGTDNLSIYLHAYSLEFVHPVRKERVRFTAPFPSYGLWKSVTGNE
jgi:23S rRNA pseudouridine1911/1915/1917 synthase